MPHTTRVALWFRRTWVIYLDWAGQESIAPPNQKGNHAVDEGNEKSFNFLGTLSDRAFEISGAPDWCSKFKDATRGLAVASCPQIYGEGDHRFPYMEAFEIFQMESVFWHISEYQGAHLHYEICRGCSMHSWTHNKCMVYRVEPVALYCRYYLNFWVPKPDAQKFQATWAKYSPLGKRAKDTMEGCDTECVPAAKKQ